jgi:hypothetical protein
VLVVADRGPDTPALVPDPTGQPSARPSRWEVLGAWLGLWTPPRGVVVPPVPWRRIGAAAAVLLPVLAATALIVVPDVADKREQARERAASAAATRHAAFLDSVDREQRPRRGRAQPDPEGAEPAARTRVRTALVSSARARIERDARSRGSRAIRGVDCEPFPRTLGAVVPARNLSRSWAAYDCVAVTSRLTGGQGIIGMPFRLLADFERGRFAWCRIVPLGDRDRLAHPLPRPCLRPRG